MMLIAFINLYLIFPRFCLISASRLIRFVLLVVIEEKEENLYFIYIEAAVRLLNSILVSIALKKKK